METRAEYNRRYQERNPDICSAARRRWKANNRERVRSYSRKYKGLPEPNRPPPGLCECCGTDKPGGRGGWHLDHDHVTGEFRGWLCHNCNIGIGMLGDNLIGIDRARTYLLKEDKK